MPGMPAAARAKITAQAQGIPLFAVETIRSLVDRDIVQPVEGAYRLTGEVGELAVPDSLHALLAARLDALDPGVRRLVTDAAVLGATFPAEALIAVSGQDEAVVRAALAELVRREVLSVSADRLSPERGSYGFAQNMLRQVAYDTLSRRDRKARHLAVAAHLRAAFAGDGEEVAEVIARHYLDALDAVPDDGDAGQIRGQAIAALTRAADRAGRTGAPARAAASYATAARLTQAGTPDGQPTAAAVLWEHAAEAALTNADWRRGGRAGRPGRGCVPAGRRYPLGRPRPGDRRAGAAPVGPARPGARAAHRRRGGAAGRPGHRHRPRPGRTGEAGGVRRVTRRGRAVRRGPGPGPGPGRGRGHPRRPVHHPRDLPRLRRAQAAGGRLASGRPPGWPGRPATPSELGRALLNLSDAVTGTDPAAGAEAARAAAAQLRRAGARHLLAIAVANLAQALLMTGDWDAAEAELAQAADADGLADIEFLACYRAWLAALRGEAPAAQAALAGLGDLRASEDPQDQAIIAVAEAFTAAARGQPAAALRHARTALDHAAALGISHEVLRWAWPLAARAAHDLADTATTRDLLALLDGYRPGQLAPMQRAERDLARARLAAADGDPDAGRGVRRRDQRAAPALHPLPPGPRPARPRRPPQPPRR